MRLALGFLICLALAIPTFGVSLIVFFVVKAILDAVKVNQIKASAFMSAERGGKGFVQHKVNHAAVRKLCGEFSSSHPVRTERMGESVVYQGLISDPDGRSVFVTFSHFGRGVVGRSVPAIIPTSDLERLTSDPRWPVTINEEFEVQKECVERMREQLMERLRLGAD